jgi:predicted nucleic acid-binding protein
LKAAAAGSGATTPPPHWPTSATNGRPKGLADGALPLLDTAPIVHHLEAHPELGPRFRPLFEAHAAGRVRFAITTITLAEVLTGPLRSGDEALARRYRAVLETWRLVPLDADIAETAARLRAATRLKLPDAIQAASALAINAAALVTHDRDFDRWGALRVIR